MNDRSMLGVAADRAEAIHDVLRLSARKAVSFSAALISVTWAPSAICFSSQI